MSVGTLETPGPSRSRLSAHVACLTVLLLVTVRFLVADYSYSADEGAVIAQVEAIQDGSWVIEHPVPELDADGRWFPLAFPSLTEAGGAPYAKLPLYPMVLVPMAGLAGVAGMVAFSVLGTVLAALGAALLSRRISGGLEAWTFWLVGVGSPLLFDSFTVMAHTTGAAAAALAAVNVLAALESERRRFWLHTCFACLLVLVCAGLRREGLFIGLALAAAVAMARSWRGRRRAVLAAALAGVALLAHLGNAWLSGLVVAGSKANVETRPPATELGWLQARLEGFANTWLLPGYSGTDPAGMAAVTATAVLLLALGVALALRPRESERLVVLGVAAATSALAALILAPESLIPGLLLAFPAVLLAAPSMRRCLAASSQARLLLGVASLFSLAVLATQYAQGGTAEWGGRYFALAIPLAAPLVVCSIRYALEGVAGRPREIVVGALCLVIASLGVTALLSLRAQHELTMELVDGIQEVVAEESDEDRPVLVSTRALVPRLSWAYLDYARWLFVPEDEMEEFQRVLGTSALSEVHVVSSGGFEVYPEEGWEASAREVVEWSDWKVWSVRRQSRR